MNKSITYLILLGWLSLYCNSGYALPSVINIADYLDEKKGISYLGPSAIPNGAQFGSVASPIGDFNKDGIDDLIITAPAFDDFKGAVYIIFGKKTPTSIDFDHFNKDQGVLITTSTTGTATLGSGGCGAGDFNKDGIVDVVIGAPGYGEFGAAFIVFGSKAPPAEINVDTLAVPKGIKITGAQQSGGFGMVVAGVGDINEDDVDDVVISEYSANNGDGAVYVIFGSKTPSDLKIDSLNPSQGVSIVGSGKEGLGIGVSGIKDANGDKIRDIIIGAYDTDNEGAVYVIYGTKELSNIIITSLTDTQKSQGFKIKSASPVPGGYFGYSVSSGYVNGDTIQDIIIGEPNDGKVHVIYGKEANIAGSNPVTTNNGGFIITHNDGGMAMAGYSVSGGDVNGDWYDDILIGAPKDNGDRGNGYVVFGSSALIHSNVELTSLTAAQGIKINGDTPGDMAATYVCTGSFNGDKGIDILLASSGSMNERGSVQLIYGVPITTPPPPGREYEPQFPSEPNNDETEEEEEEEQEATKPDGGDNISPNDPTNNPDETETEEGKEESSWFDDHKAAVLAPAIGGPIALATIAKVFMILKKRRGLRQVRPQPAKFAKAPETTTTQNQVPANGGNFEVTVQELDATTAPALNRQNLAK